MTDGEPPTVDGTGEVLFHRRVQGPAGWVGLDYSTFVYPVRLSDSRAILDVTCRNCRGREFRLMTPDLYVDYFRDLDRHIASELEDALQRPLPNRALRDALLANPEAHGRRRRSAAIAARLTMLASGTVGFVNGQHVDAEARCLAPRAILALGGLVVVGMSGG